MKTLNKNEVCLLVPAYNESSTIHQVLNDIRKIGFTVLVVDDGSTDNTANICELDKNVILIKHGKNLGYVEALNTGFKFLSEKNYKYIVTLDADNQLSANDVIRFIKLANQGEHDLVVGHRNYMNRISEYIFSIFSNMFLNLKDPFCGLKLYRLDSIKKLLPFDSYNLIGSELLIRSKYNNLKIGHLPITSQIRIGESKFGNNIYGELKILKACLFILLNHFFKNKFK